MSAVADLGWADPRGRTPSDREAGGCRVCGKAVCAHPDAMFAGIVPAPFAPFTGYQPGDGDEPHMTLARDNPLRGAPVHSVSDTSEASR